MEILLAVAVMSVAAASWVMASTFRTRIRENTTQLEQAKGQITAQCAELKQTAGDLDRHLRDIRQYVRTRLDHEVARTRGNTTHRVLVGGIHPEQQAAADTLPALYESFLRELPLEILYRDSAQQFSVRFYLLWSTLNGQSLEQRLEMLLRACPNDNGAPVQGLNELRGLLRALHKAGPGTLQVGPLVIIRTRDDLIGTVLAAPQERAARLKDLAGDGLADLGSWAGRSQETGA